VGLFGARAVPGVPTQPGNRCSGVPGHGTVQDGPIRGRSDLVYGPLGEAPLRVATQATDGPGWAIDGLDELVWADVTVLAPDRPTSAREIEAGNEWVRFR
jgi:hypothetical protein